MVTVAGALAPEMVKASHEKRVRMFRELAEGIVFASGTWAWCAACVAQAIPVEANRTSVLAAAVEAAFELGLAAGAKSIPA